MKKIFVLAIGLLGMLTVNAQNKEVKKEVKVDVTNSETPGKKKVRIEKKIDGKVEIIEKEIESNGMSDAVIIDENLDTLIDGKEGKKTKVIIKERKGDQDFDIRIDDDKDFEWQEEGNFPGKRKRFYSFDDNMREFNFEMDRLHDKLVDIPYRLKGAKIYEFDDRMFKDGGPATIKAVDVFTNKPQTNVLNIRFFAPNEGDVKITVIDLNGKVVAKEDEKKFKGEYVGQIKLDKGSKGVFFVMIAQGEDGVSRKVRVD
ncbi:MAG: T9SS type A sorting domain-containing protein [Bacteroidetes bacterium]|nr:T9SS type A sorting domain-containing protein [Bacteroidota bacterium]